MPKITSYIFLDLNGVLVWMLTNFGKLEEAQHAVVGAEKFVSLPCIVALNFACLCIHFYTYASDSRSIAAMFVYNHHHQYFSEERWIL